MFAGTRCDMSSPESFALRCLLATSEVPNLAKDGGLLEIRQSHRPGIATEAVVHSGLSSRGLSDGGFCPAVALQWSVVSGHAISPDPSSREGHHSTASRAINLKSPRSHLGRLISV